MTIGVAPASESTVEQRAEADRIPRRWPSRLRVQNWPLVYIVVGCFAFYVLYSFTEHLQYLTNAYDLGIFDQEVRAYAHFHAPVVPLKAPGYVILGDHFSPILALLAPLYWIWDSPYMLLLAQAALVASAVPVVYRFTRRRSGRRFALAISALYGFAWPIQTLVDFDFHEVAFAVPILALVIDALDRRDHRAVLLWSLPLLFVREDMGILIAIVGAIMLIRDRAIRRAALGKSPTRRSMPSRVGQTGRSEALREGGSGGRAGIVAPVLLIGGLIAYEATTRWVIPAFSPDHTFAYWQFGVIGSNLPDALFHIVTRPWHAAHVFVTPGVKFLTLTYLVLPLALLSLRSPYVVIALPLLAERFFNQRENLWTPHFQYDALPWLILTLAAIDGAGRWGLFAPDRRSTVLRKTFVAWLAVTQIGLSVWVAHGYAKGTNLASRLTSWDSSSVRARRAGDAFIPSDVCVATGGKLASHLTSRDYVTMAQLPLGHSDIVLLDLSEHDLGRGGASPETIYQTAMQQGYSLGFARGPIVALYSPGYSGPSPECAPLGPGKS
jgi:uncharacterized membrane protein